MSNDRRFYVTDLQCIHVEGGNRTFRKFWGGYEEKYVGSHIKITFFVSETPRPLVWEYYTSSNVEVLKKEKLVFDF